VSETPLLIEDQKAVLKVLVPALKTAISAIEIYRPTCLAPGCGNHGAYIRITKHATYDEPAVLAYRCAQHKEPGYELGAGEAMLDVAVDKGKEALRVFEAMELRQQRL